MDRSRKTAALLEAEEWCRAVESLGAARVARSQPVAQRRRVAAPAPAGRQERVEPRQVGRPRVPQPRAMAALAQVDALSARVGRRVWMRRSSTLHRLMLPLLIRRW